MAAANGSLESMTPRLIVGMPRNSVKRSTTITCPGAKARIDPDQSIQFKSHFGTLASRRTKQCGRSGDTVEVIQRFRARGPRHRTVHAFSATSNVRRRERASLVQRLLVLLRQPGFDLRATFVT